MEGHLRSAADEGVRSLVVRAGDFFGAHQPSSWLKDAMIKPGEPLRSVLYPGDPNVGHAWAYLPDFAQAIVRLAEIEQTLPPFDVFHFGGYWIEPGAGIAKAIGRVAAQPYIKIRSAPWLLFRLAAPFSPFLRELLEMRYLWRNPIKLDNRKLVALIGDEPHRPLEEALHDVLAAFGCLTEPSLGADRANLEAARS
jgi:nucleoside-diphosphate-sugar epimerase